MITAIDLFTLSGSSALRPPAWRWELAKVLNDRRRDPGLGVDHHDPDVRSASLMQDLAGCNGTDEDRVKALESIGVGGADAYVFHTRSRLAADLAPPGADDRDYPLYGPLTSQALARAHLDALILANKAPASIAKTVGLHESAVSQYERWWFDVRDRLGSRGWVAANVIGSLQQGSPALLMPALIRAYGYYTKSSRVVQAAVGMFDADVARGAAKNPAKFFSSDAVAAGGLKAAIAVRLMPLTRKTYARVIDMHHAAMDIAVKAGETAGSDEENKYRSAMGKLLGKVDYQYRQPPTETVEPLRPRVLPQVDSVG